MGECRIPAAKCSNPRVNTRRTKDSSLWDWAAAQPKRAMEGTIHLGKVVMAVAQFKHLGIKDPDGFLDLAEEMNRLTGGLHVAFGYSPKQEPCLYEFKVKSERTGFLGSGRLVHTSTLDLVAQATYVKGRKDKRSYYVAGDTILLSKIRRKEVKTYLYLDVGIEDKRPGALKLLSWLTSDGKQKAYVCGFHIVSVLPFSIGGGTGDLVVQPIVFFGDVPQPMGKPKTLHVKRNYGRNGKRINRDLNSHWNSRKTWDGALNTFVMAFTEGVAKTGEAILGGGLVKKAAGKALGRYAKKKIKSKIKKGIAKGLAKGTAAFLTAFAGEIVQLANQRFDSVGEVKGSTSFKINQHIVEKATVKGIASFVRAAVKEGLGIGLEKLIPDAAEKALVGKIAVKFLKVNLSFLVDMATGLIDMYADKRDPITGRISEKHEKEAMKKYLGRMKNCLGEVVDEIPDGLAELVVSG